MSQEGTTQGDPLAMAMYAISTVPLIHRLSKETIKQAWFADDASAVGDLSALREWWDRLVQIGPEYGYHPNPPKTWLIVKEESYSQANLIFQGTGVSITKEGKRLLGAAVGKDTFRTTYVQEKVAAWVRDVERLTHFASTQPHAAYAAFTHGLASKWTFIARTIPNIEYLFQPLEDTIRQRFLPVLTGQNSFSDNIRDLMALPARLGGLGIINPAKQAAIQHHTSREVTAPLVNLILEQSKDFPMEALEEQLLAKNAARQARHQAQISAASDLHGSLPNSLQRAVEISRESGASSWLTALPLTEHGFTLHKGAFRDALCLRYGWRPPLLPSQCVCDKTFNIEHALSCPYGGFPSIRHNEIRDITAHLMSDICHNVGTEPVLQPVTDERLTYRTANLEDGARVDIKAQGFWGNDGQCAFFDVRVFNPFAHPYRNLPLTTCYRRNEQEKRRAYDQRVREIEHDCFSPLVFSASGGMGPTAKVIYKKLASMIATKHNQCYSHTLNWVRCRLSFSLLRSAIMCLRGSRSSANSPAHPQLHEAAIDRALCDSRVGSRL